MLVTPRAWHESRRAQAWLTYNVGPKDMSRFDTDFLIAAGFLFERERGVPQSSFEKESMIAAGLEAAHADKVASDIWAALEENPPADWRRSAYWALGKRYRKEDKNRFVSALKLEVSRNADVAYQIMVALDNLREPVFAQNRSCRGADEKELNLADATKYIALNP